MPEITKDMIVQLRTKTGAGMMDCKTALNESKGNMEEAMTILRKKGIAVATKRAGKTAGEGCIYSYIHPGDKIGVLLEINCETDFVSRTDDFKKLARELSMQIAAMNPKWVKPEDVSSEALAKEKEILKDQAIKEGKPAAVADKIVQGRLDKFYQQNCLAEQMYIRDTTGKLAVKDIINEYVGKLGENIVIRRFVRFQLGGE